MVDLRKSLFVQWRDEWDASEELQFQHPDWLSHVYQEARKHWEARPAFQRGYGGDFDKFAKEERAISSEVWAARRKSEEVARNPMMGKPAQPNTVAKFTDHILGRKRE